jgi:predicted PurR-regulated permease PerM
MSHCEALLRPTLETRGTDERIFVIVVAAVAATAFFAGLVYAVLLAAHVSEPAASAVYGLTIRRLWATAAAVLALVGVVVGGLALVRPVGSALRQGHSARFWHRSWASSPQSVAG